MYNTHYIFLGLKSTVEWSMINYNLIFIQYMDLNLANE